MADDTPKDEKTEEATPRKQEQGREKGQVAYSQELVSAMMLSFAAIAAAVSGAAMYQSLGLVTRNSIQLLPRLGTDVLAPQVAAELLKNAARTLAPAFLAVLLPLLAVGLIVGYGQIGFRIAPKAIAAEWSKLSPIKGFSRIFGARALMRFGLAIAKLGALILTLGAVGSMQVPRLMRLGGTELGPALRVVLSVLAAPVAAALAAILMISLFDVLFQRFQHGRDQRMSKKEVKDDMKQTEGDPHVRARVRQIQREMASRRMMAEVPKATVVVTNPTHVAVALRYEKSADGTAGAPRVIAKGIDAVAQRIKGVATEAGVPLYEDVPLARALNARAEIGDEIPEDLYEAVAVVIGYVWRTRQSTGQGAAATA